LPIGRWRHRIDHPVAPTVRQDVCFSSSAHNDGAPRSDDDRAAARYDSAAWAGAARAINAPRANDGFGGRNGDSRDGNEFGKSENRKSGEGRPALH
jgi:hypothetical protein